MLRTRAIAVAALLLAAHWATATGQAQSLTETKAWIESEGPRILETTTATTLGLHASRVDDLVVDTGSCVASWSTPNGLLARVPLKDVDTLGVALRASDMLGAPVVRLRLKTVLSAGPTIYGWNMGKQGQVDSIEMLVRNREDGERLAGAFKRAAMLCGAAPPF